MANATDRKHLDQGVMPLKTWGICERRGKAYVLPHNNLGRSAFCAFCMLPVTPAYWERSGALHIYVEV